MGQITVYDENEKATARVKYNNNLDFWDGSNWTSGSTGRHKGITRLRDGRYVLIFGSQWQGERDHAIIIDEDRAIEEILRHPSSETQDELLKRFKLEDKAKSMFVEEEEF